MIITQMDAEMSACQEIDTPHADCKFTHAFDNLGWYVIAESKDGISSNKHRYT